MNSISIIIPVLNEESQILSCLESLLACRRAGHEVIVVDGGSTDETCVLAQEHCDQLLHAESGRAAQMNYAASHARGQILLFLHVDTRLPADFAQHVVSALESPAAGWGRFDVSLSGRRLSFSIIARCMNLRSRWTGIATGDQVIFVRRELFEQVQGYASLALMEDIDLSRRLKRLVSPVCLPQRVITSSRRWEQQGVLRTVLKMWTLRLAYFFGVSSHRLAKLYDK